MIYFLSKKIADKFSTVDCVHSSSECVVYFPGQVYSYTPN